MTRPRIVAVCTGGGGIPKHEVESASVSELGLTGDAHRFRRHGGRDRAVCLFAEEDYRALQRDGVSAPPPGAFGENVLTRSLDYRAVRPGDILRLGDEVVLEVFDVRQPCATLEAIDRRFPNLMVGRSGFVCRVIEGGVLRAGLAIVHEPGRSGG